MPFSGRTRISKCTQHRGSLPSINFILFVVALCTPLVTATIEAPVARLTTLILGLVLLPVCGLLAMTSYSNLARIQERTGTALFPPVQAIVTSLARTIFSLAYATTVLDVAILLALKSNYLRLDHTPTGALSLTLLLTALSTIILLGPFVRLKLFAMTIEPIGLLALGPRAHIDILALAVWQTLFAIVSVIILAAVTSRAQMQTINEFFDGDDTTDTSPAADQTPPPMTANRAPSSNAKDPSHTAPRIACTHSEL